MVSLAGKNPNKRAHNRVDSLMLVSFSIFGLGMWLVHVPTVVSSNNRVTMSSNNTRKDEDGRHALEMADIRIPSPTMTTFTTCKCTHSTT